MSNTDIGRGRQRVLAARKIERAPTARPSLPPSPPAVPAPTPVPSTAEQAVTAAAGAVERAGAQQLRVDRTHQLIGSMVALVSGFSAGDDEMAISALATVVGQVMASHQAPQAVLAYVVRVATQTAATIKTHQAAAAQQAAQKPA